MDSWSKAETCELIQLYREAPCLWNTRLVDYKNKNRRAIELEKIHNLLHAKNINHTLKAIRNKIQTIRNQYRKENNAKTASLKSGAGSADVYEPKLWFYSLMDFLKDDIISETTSSFSEVSWYTDNVLYFNVITINFVDHVEIGEMSIVFYKFRRFSYVVSVLNTSQYNILLFCDIVTSR